MANTYRTEQGDTWDIISLKNYGSEKYIDVLMDQNYQHINQFIFPAGVVLIVPDLPTSAVNNQNLPPWKRR